MGGWVAFVGYRAAAYISDAILVCVFIDALSKGTRLVDIFKVPLGLQQRQVAVPRHARALQTCSWRLS